MGSEAGIVITTMEAAVGALATDVRDRFEFLDVVGGLSHGCKYTEHPLPGSPGVTLSSAYFINISCFLSASPFGIGRDLLFFPLCGLS